MACKKTIEDEINDFLNHLDPDGILDFLKDIIPILELYNVQENDDWVMDIVGKEEATNVRLIRTVYLLSRVCSLHAGKLLSINLRYKDLWKRMEKVSDVMGK